jgi:hypothetical protein
MSAFDAVHIDDLANLVDKYIDRYLYIVLHLNKEMDRILQ